MTFHMELENQYFSFQQSQRQLWTDAVKVNFASKDLFNNYISNNHTAFGTHVVFDSISLKFKNTYKF